ncbi:MAG: DUF4157 domain-containing protein [Candidatus Accumulibacter delftensis]|jgi:hypothetical protein
MSLVLDRRPQPDAAPPGSRRACDCAGPTRPTPGVPRCLGGDGVQARLEVGEPDDPLEHEAEAFSRALVAGSTVPRFLGHDPGAPLRRTCPQCAEELVEESAEPGNDEQPLRREYLSAEPPDDGDGGRSGTADDARPARNGSAATGLHGAVRGQLEAALGTDLGAIRVHQGKAPARAARAIGARAFTRGRDIWLGARERTDDLALMAHEVAHVVQQRGRSGGVLRRLPEDEFAGMTSADAASVAVPLATSSSAARPSLMPPGAGAAYDPCAVSARALSNAELLAHWQRVVAYLGDRRPDSQPAYDHDHLRRRLAGERRRRGGMGHSWLAEERITAVPTTLYEIRPIGPEMLAVVLADVAREEGPAFQHEGQVLTPAQFDRFLARYNVPQVDVNEFYASHDPFSQALTVRLPPPTPEPAPLWPGFSAGPESGMGPDFSFADPGARGFPGVPGRLSGASTAVILPTDLYANPTDLYIRDAFLRPLVTPGTDPANPASMRGAGVNWRGTMFEELHLGADLSTILDPSVVDLNSLQANAPTFDTLDLRTGDLESLTHSMSGVDTGGPLNPDHYLTKFMRMMSPTAEGSTLTSAADMLGPVYPEFGTDLDAAASARLLVPDEHAGAVRAAVETMVAGGNLSRADFAAGIERAVSASPSRMTDASRAIIEASLSADPISHGDGTYSSWDQVRALSPSSRAYRTIRAQLTARLRARALSGDLRGAVAGSVDAGLASAWRERASAGRLAPVVDALVHGAPVGGGAAAISNWAQIEALILSGDVDATVRIQAVFGEVAQRAGARVAPMRATLASVMALQRLNTLAVSRLQRNVLFPPEVVEYHRLVANGMATEDALSTVSGGSAARAARVSGALAALTESGRLLWHAGEGDLNGGMVATSMFNVGASIPVGYGGALVESRAALGLSQWASRGLVAGETPGLLASSGVLGGRLFVSTGVGAVAAPVISLGSMAFQETFLDADYSDIDYYATGARTAVAGGGGALAAGITGAVLGSEVPLLGNAVGFIVGFGGYLLVDSIWGDDIEHAVREGMGEFGCVDGAAD